MIHESLSILVCTCFPNLQILFSKHKQIPNRTAQVVAPDSFAEDVRHQLEEGPHAVAEAGE